jgi:DNA-binding CsgD family transcriptional regulator/tetratricopeptide (TPR) repeat protein
MERSSLERGRESYARRAWAEAYEQLSAAEGERPLEVEDVVLLATAAYLTGRDGDCREIWARAHRQCLSQGDVARAARCAFWLAFGLMSTGEMAGAGGWLARAQRLIDENELDCAERGYLLVPMALRCVGAGDFAGARDKFVEALAIGERFGDPDLRAFGLLGRGQTLIGLGARAEGLALLDEVIVAVTAGEVSPLVVGLVYCGAIEACRETFDLRRAQEWTAALSHWCDSQPDLVHYRGQCLVHRAEIMAFHGAWPDAAAEVQLACERLSGEPAVGAAFYQQAELHRLRGHFTDAEDAYRLASHWGREPQPGLALLRLAQGQDDAAQAAIRRVADEAEGPVARSRLLGPYVEIMLAAGDVRSARHGADELCEIAAALDALFLHALAAHVTAAVLLAEGEARAALPVLRRAWAAWRDLEAPYQAARVRLLIGLACQALGDRDTAEMEIDAARLGFQQLGAATDLARVEVVARKAPTSGPQGLTARELEVLVLVAKGKTNREISAGLVISEHTVARHVQNIFAKVGVSSRTAAGAFAFEHGLV